MLSGPFLHNVWKYQIVNSLNERVSSGIFVHLRDTSQKQELTEIQLTDRNREIYVTEEGSTLGLQYYHIILIMTMPIGPTFPLKLCKNNQVTIMPLYVTFKCKVSKETVFLV